MKLGHPVLSTPGKKSGSPQWVVESGDGEIQPESTAEAGAHSGGGTRGGGAGGRARRLRPYPDHLGPSVALFPRVRGSRPFLGLFWLAPDGEAMLEPLGERAGAPAGGADGAPVRV